MEVLALPSHSSHVLPFVTGWLHQLEEGAVNHHKEAKVNARSSLNGERKIDFSQGLNNAKVVFRIALSV